MSKNIEHLQHIKSNVVIEGKPKLPTAEVLVEGELAVNYAEGYETISLRNSNSDITTFSSDDYYTKKKLGSGFTGDNSANTVTSVIEENEEIVASALNDLNSRKLDASAYTPTDLSNYYTKSETSGATELQTAFNGKTDTAITTALNNVVTAHTANTNIHLTTTEKGQLHTHTNKTYIDSITGTVGTMAYENASSYSSATEVNTALASKSGTGHTHYWANLQVSSDVNYITEPEIKSVKINGSTSNEASTNNCHIQYDTTNKCLKFLFN